MIHLFSGDIRIVSYQRGGDDIDVTDTEGLLQLN